MTASSPFISRLSKAAGHSYLDPHDPRSRVMTANPKATDKQGYHQFKVDGTGQLYESFEHGSFEVFWGDAVGSDDTPYEDAERPEGWYWWACFPGCLPDGEPSGPFDTSQKAYDDAQEGA